MQHLKNPAAGLDFHDTEVAQSQPFRVARLYFKLYLELTLFPNTAETGAYNSIL